MAEEVYKRIDKNIRNMALGKKEKTKRIFKKNLNKMNENYTTNNIIVIKS